MKREMLDGWLSALRSDEYEQGTGMLKYENKFCCLGVLCHLQDPNDFLFGGTEHKFAGSSYSNLEKLLGQGLVYDLWKLNDSKKATFPVIADYIEERREQIEARG